MYHRGGLRPLGTARREHVSSAQGWSLLFLYTLGSTRRSEAVCLALIPALQLLECLSLSASVWRLWPSYQHSNQWRVSFKRFTYELFESSKSIWLNKTWLFVYLGHFLSSPSRHLVACPWNPSYLTNGLLFKVSGLSCCYWDDIEMRLGWHWDEKEMRLRWERDDIKMRLRWKRWPATHSPLPHRRTLSCRVGAWWLVCKTW